MVMLKKKNQPTLSELHTEYACVKFLKSEFKNVYILR